MMSFRSHFLCQINRLIELDTILIIQVPHNVRLGEAPGFGQPAVTLFPDSKGAQAYLALATELLIPSTKA
ncbi:hypothetical protein CCB80_07795 [Armatimonadetes bacterium Uphvl-Ar1]|nr:hypothetical protein CCB80_07795 [Armatimonadetes bacterium Uphvl-Ar1]